MDLDYFLLKMKWEPGLVADIRESLSLFHLFTMIGLGQFLVFSFVLWGGVCFVGCLLFCCPWPFRSLSFVYPWQLTLWYNDCHYRDDERSIRPKKTETAKSVCKSMRRRGRVFRASASTTSIISSRYNIYHNLHIQIQFINFIYVHISIQSIYAPFSLRSGINPWIQEP